jgi:hypothetical protein
MPVAIFLMQILYTCSLGRRSTLGDSVAHRVRCPCRCSAVLSYTTGLNLAAAPLRRREAEALSSGAGEWSGTPTTVWHASCCRLVSTFPPLPDSCLLSSLYPQLRLSVFFFFASPFCIHFPVCTLPVLLLFMTFCIPSHSLYIGSQLYI